MEEFFLHVSKVFESELYPTVLIFGFTFLALIAFFVRIKEVFIFKKELKESINLLRKMRDAQNLNFLISELKLKEFKYNKVSNSLWMKNKTYIKENINENVSYFNFTKNSNKMINPELFISIGLVITFLGISAALFTTSGIFDSDINNVKNSLQNLLIMTGSKFISSTLGVFFALILPYILILASLGLKKKIIEHNNEYVDALEQYNEREILFEIHDNNEKITTILNTMKDSLAVQISDNLERVISSIPESIKDSLKPIAESLNKTNDELKSSGEENMKDISSEITKNINIAMEQMINSITDIPGIMKQVSEQMNKSALNLNDSLGNSLNKLNEILQKIEIDLSKNTSDSMANIYNSISGTSKIMSDMLKELSQQKQSDIQESNSAIRIMLSEMERQNIENMNVINNIVDSVKQLFSELSGKLNSEMSLKINTIADEGVVKVERVNNVINNQIKTYEESISKITKEINIISSVLSEAAKNIELGTGSIYRTTQSSNEYLSNINKQNDEIVNIFKTIEGTSDKLKASFEEMKIVLNSIRKNEDDYYDKIVDVINKTQQAADILFDAVDSNRK